MRVELKLPVGLATVSPTWVPPIDSATGLFGTHPCPVATAEPPGGVEIRSSRRLITAGAVVTGAVVTGTVVVLVGLVLVVLVLVEVVVC